MRTRSGRRVSTDHLAVPDRLAVAESARGVPAMADGVVAVQPLIDRPAPSTGCSRCCRVRRRPPALIADKEYRGQAVQPPGGGSAGFRQYRPGASRLTNPRPYDPSAADDFASMNPAVSAAFKGPHLRDNRRPDPTRGSSTAPSTTARWSRLGLGWIGTVVPCGVGRGGGTPPQAGRWSSSLRYRSRTAHGPVRPRVFARMTGSASGAGMPWSRSWWGWA